MSQHKKLSVIIPSFNRTDCLIRCLSSLLNQTLSKANYEIIIVDDHSEENQLEAIRSNNLLNNVIYERHEKNHGRSAAINTGVRLSKGEVLLLFDNDMIAPRNLLENHLLRQSELEKVLCVGGFKYYPTDRLTPLMNYLESRGPKLTKDFNDCEYKYCNTGNASIKRAYFEKVGGFEEQFNAYGWEDVELGFRLQKEGLKIVYCPNCSAFQADDICAKTFANKMFSSGRMAWIFLNLNPSAEKVLRLSFALKLKDNFPKVFKLFFIFFSLLNNFLNPFLCFILDSGEGKIPKRFLFFIARYFQAFNYFYGVFSIKKN